MSIEYIPYNFTLVINCVFHEIFCINVNNFKKIHHREPLMNLPQIVERLSCKVQKTQFKCLK